MTTVISLKLDSQVKTDATALAKSTGLTLSGIINSYLKQIVSTRRIEIYAPEETTPHLEKLIAKVEKSIQAGNISRPFDNVDDFIADLKS